MEKKISLLVVDDEKFVLSALKRLFHNPHKYEVYAASSTKEAMQLLKTHPIGVIICDFKMTPIDGADFLAMTKTKWPDISRILLTGFFDTSIAEKSVQKGGIHRFITKPWNDDDLRMTVENSWKRHQLLKQNRELLKLIKSQNDHLTHLTLNLKQLIESRIGKTLKSKEAIRSKKIQLQITHSLITGLSRAKNLKDIFKIIITELSRLIPFDDVSIVVEKNAKQHYLFNQKRLYSKKGTVRSHPLSISNYPIIEGVFKNKTPIFTQKAPAVLWNKRQFKSFLLFPLLKENLGTSSCMATINFASLEKEQFSEKDIKMISDIANPIAIAIEKIKLLEVVEQGAKQWESTFDAISDLVTVIDRKYTLLKANRATEKITGKRVESIIGKKCYEVLANRKRPCRNCPAQQTLKSQLAVSENEITDFKDKDYLSWSYPSLNKKREVDSMVVYYRDHTESSQLFSQLIQAEKMAAVGHLAGSLAHELNNPLTGITAFAQILKKDVGKKHGIYPDLLEIEKAAIRCRDVIHNLLSFSQEHPHKKIAVSLNDIIESTLPLIQYSSSATQTVRILKKLGSRLPKIKGNPNELQQVFLNLMLNAFQAMPKGGTMTIQTSVLQKQAALQVSISDTGGGISKQDLSKIFDPFYTTKEKTRGTGLGLSVSYGIIQNHKGKIAVESQPKKGSKFKVILPLEKKH